MQEIIVFKNQELASDWLALVFSGLIAQNNHQDRKTVLGFATGVSPLVMYQKLIAIHQGKYQITRQQFKVFCDLSQKLLQIDLHYLLANRIDDKQTMVKVKALPWSKVVTFNLDEFIGLHPNHQEEFANYMNHHLFKDISINKQQTHFPNVYTNDLAQAAQQYERDIASNQGIDLQLITLGINGHMAYNEPGTKLDTYTHVAQLSAETRANLVAQKKFPNLDQTPTTAMTVGVQTIMEMKQVIMASFGASKAEMTRRMLQEAITPEVTASALQNHKNCIFVLDQDAASKLQDDKKYQITLI